MDIRLKIHGRGNAWPVLLGEEHPFYDRGDYRDLSNASYSLVTREGTNISEVLIDAGHGTIQSLISGRNCIPDCICLTHGHMDHTLSVDWVVQSYWRKHGRAKLYPVYATRQVYDFLIRTYPHLEPLIEFRMLEFGQTIMLEEATRFRLTPFPVYHGSSGLGASMLLFEIEGRKILFTGDLLTPLLSEEDFERIRDTDLMVVDTNNRFPWPGTNHWSFAGGPARPENRNELLQSYILEHGPPVFMKAHAAVKGSPSDVCLSRFVREWDPEKQPFTILEFLQRISPSVSLLVHYSGTEDSNYYEQEIFSPAQLQQWASELAAVSGSKTRIRVPEPGEEIRI